MSDSFEFTLHSPLTKEDWNKIADVEHENTMFVTFQTPQGRQVRYIKCDVLDKIRAEINQYGSIWVQYTIKGHTDRDIEGIIEEVLRQAKLQVLDVIEKYRGEVSS